MNLDYDKVYTLDNEFEIIEKDNKYLFIDYNNVNWLRTNSTGKEILNRCDGKETLQNVIQQISELYSFGTDFLKEQFSDFLKEAINKELLLESGHSKTILEPASAEYPNDVWIHVTEKCNLRCPFCYSNSTCADVEQEEVDIDAVIAFLEKIPKDYRSTVLISGGEPFLFKGLPTLTKRLNELEYKNIVIITNGTVGNEIYKEVLPNIHSLQVSVDGTQAEYHERTRGKGSFDKMVKSLKLAREFNIKRLIISFTPTKYNISNLPEIPKFAYEHDIDSIHLTRLMPVGRGVDNKPVIESDPDEYETNVREFMRNMERINRRIHYIRETEEFFLEEDKKRKYVELSMAADQSKKVINRHKVTNCSLGCGTISISSDNNVYPCPSLQHEEYRLGNILEDNMEDIMQKGKEVACKYSVDNISTCKDCKMRYFCGGGCRACALGNEGNIDGEDPLCEYYMKAMLEIIWNYTRPIIDKEGA